MVLKIEVMKAYYASVIEESGNCLILGNESVGSHLRNTGFRNGSREDDNWVLLKGRRDVLLEGCGGRRTFKVGQ